MRKIYADLHNHTTASDGDLSPEELLERMKEVGVGAVGVTDHDTDSALDRAAAKAGELGIQLLPGVEISVRFKENFFTGTLHLLCYFLPELLENIDFRSALRSTLEKGRGDALVRARVDEINRFFVSASVPVPGYTTGKAGNYPEAADASSESNGPLLDRPLTFEEVAEYSSKVTRRHFALALSEKHGIREADAINRIIGNDSPAYIPSGVDIGTVHSFVRAFPVLTVLAHPAAGSFPGEGHYKEVHPPIDTVKKLLPRFLEGGLGGIEINYPGHIEEHREILRGWAAKYGLVATGGSDCHDISIRPPGVEGISKEEFDNIVAILKGRI